MKKILFIEDEIELNDAFRTNFAKTYEVDFAVDNVNGLKKAVDTNPSLIILDIILPGELDGLGLLKQLRENPYTFNIPVLVLTNLDGQEEEIKKLGAVECVVKARTSFEVLDKLVATLISHQG